LKVVVASLRPLAATHLQHEFENLEMKFEWVQTKKRKEDLNNFRALRARTSSEEKHSKSM